MIKKTLSPRPSLKKKRTPFSSANEHEMRKIFKMKKEPVDYYALIKEKVADKGYDIALVIAVSAVLLVLITFGITALILGNQMVTEVTQHQETIIERTPKVVMGPEQITFSKYFVDPDDYRDKEVTLKGKLHHYIEQDTRYGVTEKQGIYRHAILDDLGNTIELQEVGVFDIFFIRGNTTEELYEVTGVIDFTLRDGIVIVDEIRPAVREQVQVDKYYEELPVVRNYTTEEEIPKHPFFYTLIH